MNFRVEKTCNGKLLYLRYGYWVLDKRQAQVFQSRDAAQFARACKRQGGRIVIDGAAQRERDACAA